MYSRHVAAYTLPPLRPALDGGGEATVLAAVLRCRQVPLPRRTFGRSCRRGGFIHIVRPPAGQLSPRHACRRGTAPVHALRSRLAVPGVRYLTASPTALRLLVSAVFVSQQGT